MTIQYIHMIRNGLSFVPFYLYLCQRQLIFILLSFGHGHKCCHEHHQAILVSHLHHVTSAVTLVDMDCILSYILYIIQTDQDRASGDPLPACRARLCPCDWCTNLIAAHGVVSYQNTSLELCQHKIINSSHHK